MPRSLTLLPAALMTLAAVSLPAQQPGTARAAVPATQTTERLYDAAVESWHTGDFDMALGGLRRVLTAPDADAFHDRVAELTGERWTTVEVAKDARAPQWSSDGQFLAYEQMNGRERTFKVVRAAAPFDVVAEGAGSPSFAPDGRSVAWLRSTDAGNMLVWQPLGGGDAREIMIDAPAVTALTLLGSPLRAALLAGTAGDTLASLRVLTLSGTAGPNGWRVVPEAGGQPVDLVRSREGSRLAVLIGRRGAFSRSMPGFRGASRIDGFAELQGNALGERVAGESPVFSADGSTIAWVSTEGETRSIVVRRGNGAPLTVHSADADLPGLTLSPDGTRAAFQQMPREDWEIYTVTTDGMGEPVRVTREIQHDLMPQFVTGSRLLGVMGEGRHRRSYLYDLDSDVRTRLFHNNSVRTVAPEYEWAVAPSGSKVAIVSERDGDTVTPHRHLYLMDLAAPVSRATLIARVDSNLMAERALREAGERMFAPIADAVREATEEVSVARIYSYEKDLFDFDSKHITQPGNWKATEYLLATYRSFGLDAHLQPFTTVAGREIDVANVIATIPGTVDPDLVYVVGAHFDSRAEGPGADDNTSGTSMILEAARVLATRPQPATVMFVSFTGEEAGLRGAREFGRRMKDSIHVVGALNNDMMGWANDFHLDNTIRYSNAGLRDVQHAAAIGFSELITYDAFYYKSTDAHALYDAWGDIVGGIGSYPILGNPHYHQSHDVLSTINHRQLAETSKTTIATIMLMASSPSRLTGVSASGTTATWSPAVESGTMRYLVRWGPAEDPMRNSTTVTTTTATLRGARPGWHVAVKAINARGMEGWDWARTVVR